MSESEIPLRPILYLNANFLLNLASIIGERISYQNTRNLCRNSALSGKNYINKLLVLTANEKQVDKVLQMLKEVFVKLSSWIAEISLLQ